jgi:putative restriction endonuclease
VGLEEIDARVRQTAFDFLTRQIGLHGEVLPRSLLAVGFEFGGEHVPLMNPQGIFKPKVLPEIPLSITSVPPVERKDRPYDDGIGPDGILRYRYRGVDPAHRDNVGLRKAMARRVPVIYFHGIVPGKYLPHYPVYVVGDNPHALTFQVDLKDVTIASSAERFAGDLSESRRAYVTVLARQRIHQHSFRERVLRAYQETCAVCRLRHDELLEAAHILPDGHPKGEPVVPNGLALCKLHHAAFDRNILGIRPDLIVELREDVLKEIDGPMLKHGLQGFQGSRILVPRREVLRPNREFLEERYESFRKAV